MDELAYALEFTADDLAANRVGRLSAIQQARLDARRGFVWRWRGASAKVAAMSLVVVVVLVILWIVNPSGQTGGQAAMGWLVWLAIIVVGIGLSARLSRWRMNVMASGTVYRADGVASTRIRTRRGEDGPWREYLLWIGEQRFRVSGEHVLAAFTDGRPYSGYYVGTGRFAMLLSAEPR
jgi:hypothetical protein